MSLARTTVSFTRWSSPCYSARAYRQSTPLGRLRRPAARALTCGLAARELRLRNPMLPALTRSSTQARGRSRLAQDSAERDHAGRPIGRAPRSAPPTDSGGPGGPGVSDGPLMDVTPALATVMLQRDGHGMVGLLIVRLGVLVRGVVRAGHPAAGQAEPQPHPAAAAVKARQTLGRVWLDRAGAAEVVARPEVAPRLGCSWHRIPARPAVGVRASPN